MCSPFFPKVPREKVKRPFVVLETIINLLHGNRSEEIQSIGNLIAGPVSRLSALTEL